jgi:hypothetical protein
MGWLYNSAWQTKKEIVDHLARGFSSGVSVLDQASTTEGAYFLIKDPQGCTMIICCKIQKSSEGYGYKDMDELCGPYMHDCPLRLLDTPCTVPDPHGYSKKWRDSVRAFHAKKSKNKNIDLVGRAVRLYGRVYQIIGKQDQSLRGVFQGVTYRIRRSQLKDIEILTEGPQTQNGGFLSWV